MTVKTCLAMDDGDEPIRFGTPFLLSNVTMQTAYSANAYVTFLPTEMAMMYMVNSGTVNTCNTPFLQWDMTPKNDS